MSGMVCKINQLTFDAAKESEGSKRFLLSFLVNFVLLCASLSRSFPPHRSPASVTSPASVIGRERERRGMSIYLIKNHFFFVSLALSREQCKHSAIA
jgi:hypothetical protein